MSLVLAEGRDAPADVARSADACDPRFRGLWRGLCWGAPIGLAGLEAYGYAEARGALGGSAVVRSRTQGQIVSSPANTDFVSFPWDKAISRITTQHTVAVWVNVTAYASFGTIFSIPYTASTWPNPYHMIGMCRAGSTAFMRLAVTGYSGGTHSWSYMDTTAAFGTAEGWVLWVYTRNAASAVAYKNGVQAATATLTANPINWDASRQNRICLLERSAGITGEGVTGDVALAALWDRALSAAEVRQLAVDPLGPWRATARRIAYEGTSTPPPSGDFQPAWAARSTITIGTGRAA